MTQYIYPQNLKATANLWLWGLRDFVILAVAALLSVLALVQLHIFLPAVAVLCYGFLTIRMDDTTVLDFMRYAVRYRGYRSSSDKKTGVHYAHTHCGTL